MKPERPYDDDFLQKRGLHPNIVRISFIMEAGGLYSKGFFYNGVHTIRVSIMMEAGSPCSSFKDFLYQGAWISIY